MQSVLLPPPTLLLRSVIRGWRADLPTCFVFFVARPPKPSPFPTMLKEGKALRLIGELGKSGLWAVADSEAIYAFHGPRARGLMIFDRLMTDHVVPSSRIVFPPRFNSAQVSS